MSATDLILNRLRDRGQEPKRNGSGWMARCPAHDDQTPSLSISEGHGGRALVKCFAGCGTKAIVEGLGLKMRDLMSATANTQRARAATSTVFEIRTRGGDLVAEHVRVESADGKKRFSWRRDGKAGLGGLRVPDLPLYGIHDVPTDGPIVLVEGEKVADSLRGHGIAALGTVTGAASAPSVGVLEDLRSRDVRLWADHDEIGRGHMERIAAALVGIAASVRWFTWPDARDAGDDAADFFERGGTAEELRPMLGAAPLFSQPSLPRAGGAAGDEPNTDLGIARRFVALHGPDFRYVATSHRWYGWTGTHWAPDDRRRALDLCGRIARSVTVSMTDDEPARRAAERQEAKPRIEGALALAGADPMIAAACEDFGPAAWLLNCENGTVDLQTGTMRPHHREDHLTYVVPHQFDPAAAAPRWERFVSEVMGGRGDCVAFLRRFAGYALTGSVREHALLMLVGGGRNGKSVFVETLQHVFGGDLATPAPPGLLLTARGERHPTELAHLSGRRLVVANEVPRDSTFSEERVKWLVGGDTLSARRMREDFSSFAPTHKLLVVANHMPRVDDRSDAFWRRLRVVRFDVSFVGREDRTLGEKLRAEAPGILAWAVRGCLEWQGAGLGEPVTVQNATASYRRDQDILGRFLADAAPEVRCGRDLPLSKIFQPYRTWCEANGEATPKGGKSLADDLRALGWTLQHRQGGNRWTAPSANAAEPNTAA